ncbi:MAG: O-acetyl-ADP-ribose deacetylase [Dehalococcoidia bacterium]|nr:O-acetyl-ADP-ribose deacetylase [Dehalococcoidia bacterium]MDD5495003.1 O-acetyl-ADP-ribose deacetylase [Dehalococcoidia bacterium]
MEEITIGNTMLRLFQGDITRQTTDAIVNAANSGLMGGGGVDGAIHRAGGPAIVDECRSIIMQIGRLTPGRAVITTGGNLPAKYVIHTVGPIWHGGNRREPEILSDCYTQCLGLATSKNLKSISFPAISTGAYGYPPDEAAQVALNSTIDYLKRNKTSLELIVFILFDNQSCSIYRNHLAAISADK